MAATSRLRKLRLASLWGAQQAHGAQQHLHVLPGLGRWPIWLPEEGELHPGRGDGTRPFGGPGASRQQLRKEPEPRLKWGIRWNIL